jgi:putative transposase
MKKGKYTEEQIIDVLKRMEAGQKARELARELGVSEATLYTWKSKYGGMKPAGCASWSAKTAS